MNKIMIVASAALLGTTVAASAAERGASSLSPGHEMQEHSTGTSTTKGASEYSPGDRMQDKGTVGMSRGSRKGASEYSPGDRMNDRRDK